MILKTSCGQIPAQHRPRHPMYTLEIKSFAPANLRLKLPSTLFPTSVHFINFAFINKNVKKKSYVLKFLDFRMEHGLGP